MSKSNEPNVAVESAPENEKKVLHTVDVKDENGVFTTVPVFEDYKCERDCERYPDMKLYYDDMLVAITDIEEVIYLMNSGRTALIHDGFGDQIYTDDYEDEDCNYREYSDYEVLRDALASFKSCGCCYRWITCEGRKIGNCTIKFLNEEQTVVKKGAENFTAKYKVGTKAFYHKSTSEDLKASQIDSIIIKHKAGYNPSTEYVMRDGSTVLESSVLLKDKALEWVNTRS